MSQTTKKIDIIKSVEETMEIVFGSTATEIETDGETFVRYAYNGFEEKFSINMDSPAAVAVDCFEAAIRLVKKVEF